jgi:hypothetical protein
MHGLSMVLNGTLGPYPRDALQERGAIVVPRVLASSAGLGFVAFPFFSFVARGLQCSLCNEILIIARYPLKCVFQ